MDQDGKADQSANSPTSDVSIGKIMLTLCTPSDTVSGYRHVVIPFPASYKTACAEARKAFAAQMSQYTGDVALRQATQRKDGQYVWSIIHEAAWDTILEQNGEEVGVFLNDEPDKIPYNRSKNLVWFQIGGDSDGAILKVVRSYQDCIAHLKEIKKSHGWAACMSLRYDRRMVGCEADRKAYREHDIGSPYPDKVWSVLDDPEVFEYLVNLYRQPMRIQVS